jgi:hypothetical protein
VAGGLRYLVSPTPVVTVPGDVLGAHSPPRTPPPTSARWLAAAPANAAITAAAEGAAAAATTPSRGVISSSPEPGVTRGNGQRGMQQATPVLVASAYTAAQQQPPVPATPSTVTAAAAAATPSRGNGAKWFVGQVVPCGSATAARNLQLLLQRACGSLDTLISYSAWQRRPLL